MRTNTDTPDGRGNGPESDYLNRVRQRNTELQVYGSQSIAFHQTTRGLRASVRNPQLGGAGGLRWQTPDKELDPTVAVPKDTLVYISPDNPLVTTGLTDLVSGLTVKALPGIWCALQPVPAQTGGGDYNVPAYPYPMAAPSGTPLAGDIDSSSIFWGLVSGGGGGNPTVEAYNNAHAYSIGSIVWVDTATTVSSITILPGFYICIATVSASGTGNLIPQYPLPAGTVYWRLIAFGPSTIQVCSGGSGATDYGNFSGTF